MLIHTNKLTPIHATKIRTEKKSYFITRLPWHFLTMVASVHNMIRKKEITTAVKNWTFILLLSLLRRSGYRAFPKGNNGLQWKIENIFTNESIRIIVERGMWNGKTSNHRSEATTKGTVKKTEPNLSIILIGSNDFKFFLIHSQRNI